MSMLHSVYFQNREGIFRNYESQGQYLPVSCRYVDSSYDPEYNKSGDGGKNQNRKNNQEVIHDARTSFL